MQTYKLVIDGGRKEGVHCLLSSFIYLHLHHGSTRYRYFCSRRWFPRRQRKDFWIRSSGL